MGSSASSVTFSSISQAYRDLILVCSAKNDTSNGQTLRLRFNSDSGNNYSFVSMYGDGTSTGSGSSSSLSYAMGGISSTNNFTACIVQIMDYTATDKHKTVLTRDNDTTSYVEAFASRWANTAAATSFTITIGTGSHVAGTSFALYGVAA